MSDVMLLDVLRMPVPFPVDAMWLHQFVDRARQAADRIETDAAEIERLRARVLELEAVHEDASGAVLAAREHAPALAHALHVLLCDVEAADYMTGRERELFARQALVDYGA